MWICVHIKTITDNGHDNKWEQRGTVTQLLGRDISCAINKISPSFQRTNYLSAMVGKFFVVQLNIGVPSPRQTDAAFFSEHIK